MILWVTNTNVATTKEFTEDVLDAFGARNVRVKPMFGEYGIYCDDKFVGVICDNTLFLKPTTPGEEFAAGLDKGSPYPGAKEHLIVPVERFSDTEWMHELLDLTWAALPFPKPKKKP